MELTQQIQQLATSMLCWRTRAARFRCNRFRSENFDLKE